MNGILRLISRRFPFLAADLFAIDPKQAPPTGVWTWSEKVSSDFKRLLWNPPYYYYDYLKSSCNNRCNAGNSIPSSPIIAMSKISHCCTPIFHGSPMTNTRQLRYDRFCRLEPRVTRKCANASNAEASSCVAQPNHVAGKAGIERHLAGCSAHGKLAPMVVNDEEATSTAIIIVTTSKSRKRRDRRPICGSLAESASCLTSSPRFEVVYLST